jgi:membrane protease YdiL (CAAX protease family)
MKFIQQGYIGDFANWKYILPILGFFGMLGLNYMVMEYMDLDYEQLLQNEIDSSGSNQVLFENLFIFVIFLGGLFLWVKYVHKRSIKSLTTSRTAIAWDRIFFSFVLWGLSTVAMIFVSYLLNPEMLLWNFNLEKFLVLAIIVITMIPIQTSFEEYFFRGYLLQWTGIVSKNKWIPLLLTSVLFGLVHFANPEVEKLGSLIMIYYIGTGLLLGIVTLMDEGLELALGFHAANNVFTALLVTADWTAFQTDSVFKDISEPSIGFDIFLPILILYPLVLLIFWKKYQWTDWKEKLLGSVNKPAPLNNSETDDL